MATERRRKEKKSLRAAYLLVRLPVSVIRRHLSKIAACNVDGDEREVLVRRSRIKETFKRGEHDATQRMEICEEPRSAATNP